jgi:ssDNA-binding Zn-finger/Zn-ribbon topoisomerase 1
MNLYEIAAAITALVDPETGELLDFDAFDALNLERERKIENIGCWIKDLSAEAAAIKAEEDALKKRREALESKRDFGDFIEKAETKAVGRALAMLGYGTQFAADELDEGQRIVDSPEERNRKKPQDMPEPVTCEACGKEITGYTGRGGKPVPITEGVAFSREKYGKALCPECIRIAKASKKETA